MCVSVSVCESERACVVVGCHWRDGFIALDAVSGRVRGSAVQ